MTKGNSGDSPTTRTQCRGQVLSGLARIRQAQIISEWRLRPKVGAVCGSSARTDLRGGHMATCVPTAI